MDNSTEDVVMKGLMKGPEWNLTFDDVFMHSKLFFSIPNYICELMMFIIISMNERMHTRTNKVLTWLFMANASCFFYDLASTFIFTFSTLPKSVQCLFDSYQIVSETLCFVCIVFLLYDDLINTKKISDSSLLNLLFLGSCAYYAIECFLWTYQDLYPVLFQVTIITIFYSTFLFMFLKDMIMLWKCALGIKLNRKTVSRMNIARIYMCSYLIIVISKFSNGDFNILLECLGSVPGMCTMIFLMKFDSKFKKSMKYGNSKVPSATKKEIVFIVKSNGEIKRKGADDALQTVDIKN